MAEQLLTLNQVADRLGLSRQRIYQLDADLEPILSPRGEKMVARWYKPEVVEAYRIIRELAAAPRRETSTIDRVTREVAARALYDASTRVFYLDATPEDVPNIQAGLRELAAKLERT